MGNGTGNMTVKQYTDLLANNNAGATVEILDAPEDSMHQGFASIGGL